MPDQLSQYETDLIEAMGELLKIDDLNTIKIDLTLHWNNDLFNTDVHYNILGNFDDIVSSDLFLDDYYEMLRELNMDLYYLSIFSPSIFFFTRHLLSKF